MTGAKSSKLKSFLIFFLVLIMACSLAFAACNTTEEEGDDPNYSQTETDEQEITNGNFEFGTLDAEPDEYPYTSVNGWTRAVDSSAASSSVDSGIIDTEEFDALLDALLEEDDFVDWAKYKYKDKIDEDAIRSEVETELGEDAEDEDIDAEVEKRVNDKIRENFKNPGTPADAVGGKVLMINNYRSSNENDPFTGTAQKYTSSTRREHPPCQHGFLRHAGRIFRFQHRYGRRMGAIHLLCARERLFIEHGAGGARAGLRRGRERQHRSLRFGFRVFRRRVLRTAFRG